MSPFRIEYSPHAQQRLKQRGATRYQVRRCVIHGNLIRLDVNGRKVKSLRFSNRILEVIYIDAKDGIVIITAYWRGLYP